MGGMPRWYSDAMMAIMGIRALTGIYGITHPTVDRRKVSRCYRSWFIKPPGLMDNGLATRAP